jgi:transcriptional regulator with XRE-family HTH domain
VSRPTPPAAPATAVEQLRALMVERDLTQREVAELAGVSIKTVEGWLADPESASHRGMAARYLKTILALLPRYLAARRRRKT